MTHKQGKKGKKGLYARQPFKSGGGFLHKERLRKQKMKKRKAVGLSPKIPDQ